MLEIFFPSSFLLPLSVSISSIPLPLSSRNYEHCYYPIFNRLQCCTMFLLHVYLTEAFGIWSDMSHYIYMVLLFILNELRHFGICNDDLLFPTNNSILFPALHCYL
jgi:hypothetical protein